MSRGQGGEGRSLKPARSYFVPDYAEWLADWAESIDRRCRLRLSKMMPAAWDIMHPGGSETNVFSSAPVDSIIRNSPRTPTLYGSERRAPEPGKGRAVIFSTG